MHVTLVMVTSVDGMLIPNSSRQDQDHFRRLKHKYPVIIMGRKTYDAVKNKLVLSVKNLRIVLTKNPQTFTKDRVPGQLEFTDESPIDLTNRLDRLGPTRSLLVGGSDVNELFLKAKLITDCYITIEPRFFGSGKNIFTSDSIDVPLTLIDVTRLNKQGTLLLHYMVSYEY